MDGSFKTATWLEWAKALPAEVTQVRPVLSVSIGWALLNNGELENVETQLQDAERWLNAETDASEMVVVDEAQFRTLPGSIASARTYHAQSLGDNCKNHYVCPASPQYLARR